MVGEMDKKKDVNAGHRERLKARYLKSGLDGFAAYEVLEFLLCFAIPRRDVKPIARELLGRFETIDGVLEASITELMQVKGIGEHSAILLDLIPQVDKYYQVSKNDTTGVLLNSDQAGEYLKPYFLYERDEVVMAVLLDSKRKVLSCREIARGEVNSANVNMRMFIKLVLNHNAAAVILAHNHISGIAIPSAEDELNTVTIKKVLTVVGVELVDHIIVAHDDFVSMKDSGMI